jgi:hypothetical protein
MCEKVKYIYELLYMQLASIRNGKPFSTCTKKKKKKKKKNNLPANLTK